MHPQNATNTENNLTPMESQIVSHIPPPPTDPPPTAQGTDDRTPPLKEYLEIGAVLIAFGLLVVNIFVLCATRKAADAATKAANTAEKTMVLDERAGVGVPSVNGTRPEVGQKQLKFVVHFTNTGRSPALNLIVYPGEEVLGKGVVPNFTKDIGLVRLGILSPGSERTYENFVSIASVDVFKTQTLSVHGKISYDDIFGCHHWVTYAAYLREDWSGFSFYPEHNDTDNDYQPCQNK